MIANVMMMTLTAGVILALYHQVKAWDDRQERLPRSR